MRVQLRASDGKEHFILIKGGDGVPLDLHMQTLRRLLLRIVRTIPAAVAAVVSAAVAAVATVAAALAALGAVAVARQKYT